MKYDHSLGRKIWQQRRRWGEGGGGDGGRIKREQDFMTSYYLSCLLHELIKLNPALWRCGHMQQSRERMSSWRHEHLSPLIMLERSVGDAGSGYSGVLPWHGRTREGGRDLRVCKNTFICIFQEIAATPKSKRPLCRMWRNSCTVSLRCHILKLSSFNWILYLSFFGFLFPSHRDCTR